MDPSDRNAGNHKRRSQKVIRISDLPTRVTRSSQRLALQQTATTTTVRAAPSSTAIGTQASRGVVTPNQRNTASRRSPLSDSTMMEYLVQMLTDSGTPCPVNLPLPQIGSIPASRGGHVSIVGTNHRGSNRPTFDFNSIGTWTVREVGNFFMTYYPSVAAPFMEFQVDGHALLLLRRVDIVSRFNLTLGPALHLYQLVRKLQSGNENLINQCLERFYSNV